MPECSQCKQPIAGGAKFCPECGKPVTSPHLERPVAAPKRAPQRAALVVAGSIGVFLLLLFVSLNRGVTEAPDYLFPTSEPNALSLKRGTYASLAQSLDLDTLAAVPDNNLSMMISARTSIADTSLLRQLEAEYARRRRITAWRTSTWTDEMSGKTVVSAYLLADRPTQLWLDEQALTLHVRCMPGDVDVFLVTGSSGHIELGHTNQTRMRLRFDAGTARSEWWSESTDGESYFAPAPRRLVGQLRQADTLRVEFTPFNADPQVSAFDVGGLRYVLEDELKPCGSA